MDLYELTMAYNYFKQRNKKINLFIFDIFYRKTRIMEGFLGFAGLQQLIECIKRISLVKEILNISVRFKKFDRFLDYLSNFKFTRSFYLCNEEGTWSF